VVYNGKLYGRISIDGITHWFSFDPVSKAVVTTLVPTTELTATLGGIRYTFHFGVVGNNGDDVAPFHDGVSTKWLTHGTRWDSSTGTTSSVDAWIILSSDASTIVGALTETTYTSNNQRMYGSSVLRFDTHEVNGNVTIGGTPTANVNVGVLNSEGKVVLQTKTDINGDYTLTCLDGNTKQVVAHAANGTSEVHGQVTPTEVL
jgi:hypothetical protein